MKGFAEKLVRLTTKNGNVQFEHELLPGLWKGLFIRVSGTNNSGQTAGHGDFKFYFNHNGRQLMHLDGAFIKELDNQELGAVEATSVDNSTLALAFLIPFALGGVDNSILVQPGDTITVTYEPKSTYATKVASATVTVYGIKGDAPQRYLPTLLPNHQTIGGAASIHEPLPFKNIKEVWLNGTYITNVAAHRDGDMIASGVYSDFIAFTSLLAQVEGAQVTYAKLNFGNAINDFLSENVSLELTVSQADTVLIYALGFDFDQSRTQASIQQKRVDVQKRIAKNPKTVDALPILRDAVQSNNTAE